MSRAKKTCSVVCANTRRCGACVGRGVLKGAGCVSRCALALHVVVTVCVVAMQAVLSHPFAGTQVPAEQWRQHLVRWQSIMVLPWCLVCAGYTAGRVTRAVCCGVCPSLSARRRVAEAAPPTAPASYEGDAPPTVTSSKQRGGDHLVRRRYPLVPPL